MPRDAGSQSYDTLTFIKIYPDDHKYLKVRQARNEEDRLPDVVANIIEQVKKQDG